MGLAELIPVLKVVAEVGVMLLMSVIVASCFIWIIRYAMPQAEARHREAMEANSKRHREAMEAASTQHREDIRQTRGDFFASLIEQRKTAVATLEENRATFREILTEQRESFLATLGRLETRVGELYEGLSRRLEMLEQGMDEVCKYRPRGQNWSQLPRREVPPGVPPGMPDSEGGPPVGG